MAAGPGRRCGRRARRPGGAGRHPAHLASHRPAAWGHDGAAAVSGAGPWPAPAPPTPSTSASTAPTRLELHSDDVALEGANTSFQVHLRVDPAAFVRTYNAVQLATAPVLAVAGNSPTFLGHRLWEETRIALCKQSIDDRDGRGLRRRPARVAFGTGWLREGPLALFAEAVRLHKPLLPVLGDQDPLAGGADGQAPPLAELRLHQGTVWRWNRPVYDPALGGHLRIELRALPTGPTVVDMLANAAFLIGLSRWVASEDERWTWRLSFERAEHGFYRAAQHGLAAELTWPFGQDGRLRTLSPAVLVPELLPAAREGLVAAGVAAPEADHLLGVIAARVRSGQTGAVWQRQMLAAGATPGPRARPGRHAGALPGTCHH